MQACVLNNNSAIFTTPLGLDCLYTEYESKPFGVVKLSVTNGGLPQQFVILTNRDK